MNCATSKVGPCTIRYLTKIVSPPVNFNSATSNIMYVIGRYGVQFIVMLGGHRSKIPPQAR
jgi:hypothetical protein